MRATTVSAVAILSVCLSNAGAEPAATATREANYKGWGWDEVLVLDNGLIHLSVVPVAGARVLEYNLDGHPSLHITEDELGKVYEPTDEVKGGADWRNYGGFRVGISPTENTSVQGNRFPPPVTIDTGPYDAQILEAGPEQATIRVISQTQVLPVPKWNGKKQEFVYPQGPVSKLKMERTMTIFPGSSRVRIEQSLINVGDAVTRRGFKGVSQSRVRHGDDRDYDNFWCYFPLNPNSVMGHAGVSYSGGSGKSAVDRGQIRKDDTAALKRYETGPMPHWCGEVLPGIYGAHFSNLDSSGVFADPHVGWMCYVDERDGYLYAKVFDVSDEWVYGNASEGDGARLSVYNSSFFGDGREYMELEVMSPITDIEPNGGRLTFVEDWYAARVHGPIYRVNHQGAVARPLHLNRKAAGLLTGEYGVFHNGTVGAVLLDADGDPLRSTRQVSVSPRETLRFREYLGKLPLEAARVELHLTGPGGDFIGLLDTADLR